MTARPLRAARLVLVLGSLAVLVPIALHVYQRQLQERDVREVAQLRAAFDSTLTAMAAPTTAADSARLVGDVREREYWLGRREYHLIQRQAQLASWWRPMGFPAISVALGVVLFLVAVLVPRRGKAGGG